MKKVLFLILMLGLVASVSYSQVGFSKGIIRGLNLATLSGADAPSGIKTNTGYAAGLYLELNIPGPFSIEGNALYSIKGGKQEAGSITYTNTYSYVDVPVLLKYHFPVPVVSPCIYAGPMYSTLVSAKSKQEGGLLPGERDVKDALAKSDVGAVVGVGVGFTSLRIDARYSMGLSTLDPNGNFKIYNRVISIYVGLSL